MNIKYTSDGKKVIIVGVLNAQETIVQEIFVSGGSEVPSGENFVVKSLHDAPAVSWKEKNLKELEARYDKERKQWDTKIEKQQIGLNKEYKKAKLRASALFNFDKNATHEALETAIKFLGGEITHAYCGGYYPKIYAVDDDHFFMKDSWNGRTIEDLKIITLFGKTNGDVSFKLGQYSDGSGSSSEIKPATSYEEALGFAQEELEERCEAWLDPDKKVPSLGPSFKHWEEVGGIVIPKAAQKKREKLAKEQKQKEVDELTEKLKEAKTNLKGL